jgi:death on curing protein
MKLANTAFIDIETVLAIHRDQLRAHGGQDGVRDRAGLESAVAQPNSGFGDHEFYPSVFDKAAVYAFGISEGQCFVDGNKRTALVVALTFLALNGNSIVGCQMDLYDAMMKVANKQLDREQLAEVFRNLYIKSNFGI